MIWAMIPNMFEFSIALRYLLPNKKHKTLSFVGVFATFVIAIVLWLLMVFLSITKSIESQWLSKMTALSAPIRIKPTKNYFSSYYYQIDQHAEASNYRLKTLKDKLESPLSDPFNPEIDQNIAHLPMPHRDNHGQLVDPVKRLEIVLNRFNAQKKIRFQEYALAAGALHLNLKKEGQNQTLNQILYLTSYSNDTLDQGRLIESWDVADLNHLLKNTSLEPYLWKSEEILRHVDIQSISIEPFKLPLPKNFSSKDGVLEAFAEINAEGKVKKVMVVPGLDTSLIKNPHIKKGLFNKKTKTFDGQLLSDNQLYLGSVDKLELEAIKPTDHGRKFLFKGQLADQTYFFELSAQDFSVSKFKIKKSVIPQIQEVLTKASSQSPHPVLVPKSFKEQGAKIGDKGFLSYGAKTVSGFQEMKTPILVAGFYDPGLFSVGAKVLLASRDLIELIGTSATTYALDPGETNGFLIFTPSFKEATSIQTSLQEALVLANIDSYFEIQTYNEYPFVKEILEQFGSDKLIFFLVAFIIFMVALSNVSFLMQLLVRDKSHEMAIIRSLGASYQSIRKIFMFAGIFLGLISTLIAYILAFLTLHFIQPILKALSLCMGQSMNLSQFYGIAHHVHIEPSLLLILIAVVPLLCAIAAGFATGKFRKKTCAEFLKEPR